MQLVTIRCPACQAEYLVADVLIGRTIRCPAAACRRDFVVLNNRDETPPEIEPPDDSTHR